MITAGLQSFVQTQVRSGLEKGISSFLRGWYARKFQDYAADGLHPQVAREQLLLELETIQGIESISFGKAVRGALQALAKQGDDEFEAICQWLGAEGFDASVHRKFGILQKVDKTTAPMMLRSLAQTVRVLGYSGLVILLDELEQRPSMSGNQRELLLGNLRELIDETGHANFKSTMIFYAVPDEQFLEGRTQTYEALRQRLATVFEDLNPTGVKIQLEKVIPEPVPFLREVGKKVAKVYERAYGDLDDALSVETIDLIAEDSAEKRWGDIGYKRVFAQELVKGFHILRRRGVVPSLTDLA